MYETQGGTLAICLLSFGVKSSICTLDRHWVTGKLHSGPVLIFQLGVGVVPSGVNIVPFPKSNNMKFKNNTAQQIISQMVNGLKHAHQHCQVVIQQPGKTHGKTTSAHHYHIPD